MDLVDRIVYLEHGKIMQVFTPEAFRQLSEDTREHMGLRAIDLHYVLPPRTIPLRLFQILSWNLKM